MQPAKLYQCKALLHTRIVMHACAKIPVLAYTASQSCSWCRSHHAVGRNLPESLGMNNHAESAHRVRLMRCAQVFNLGFTTHTGTVAAADEWGEPVQRMPVNPSIPGSTALQL